MSKKKAEKKRNQKSFKFLVQINVLLPTYGRTKSNEKVRKEKICVKKRKC